MSAKGEKPHHHRRRHRHRATFLHVGTYWINFPSLRLLLQKEVEMICSWPKTRIRLEGEKCLFSSNRIFLLWRSQPIYNLFYDKGINTCQITVEVVVPQSYTEKCKIEVNLIRSSCSNLVGLLILDTIKTKRNPDFQSGISREPQIVEGWSRNHFDIKANLCKKDEL